MRRSERMAVAVSVVCLGLLYLSQFSLPDLTVPLPPPAPWPSITVRGDRLLAGLLVSIVCIGVHATIPEDPYHARRMFFRALGYWPLPALTIIAASVLVPVIDQWSYQVLAIGMTGGALTVLAYLQVVSREGQPASRSMARVILGILSYGAAWAAMTAVLSQGWRTLTTSLAVASLGGGLALALLRDTPARLRAIWLYAGIAAVAMGELAICQIAINGDPWMGGLGLLVIFYCLVGVSRQQLGDGLDRRAITEYGMVAAIGFVLPLLIAR